MVGECRKTVADLVQIAGFEMCRTTPTGCMKVTNYSADPNRRQASSADSTSSGHETADGAPSGLTDRASEPRIQPIVCVNSTLSDQAGRVSSGAVSPIHLWGFRELPHDAVLCHRLNRYEVVLRSRIRGLDLGLLVAVLHRLLRGYRRIYLVSVPDLLVVLPLIKQLFPSVRIVTWAWIGDDVTSNLAYLRACEHVFCLTEGAVTQMEKEGLGHRASLELWGADPSYYSIDVSRDRCFDVSLLGQTLRDLESAVAAMALGGFTVATTERVMRSLGPHFPTACAPSGLSVVRAETHGEVVELFQRSRVSWIPLKRGDLQPTGYTNLAESLLCGTPVVIADSSTIPSQVLALPGVHLYRTGDVNDLVMKTREALATGLSPDYAERIRIAAARLLDGRQLGKRLDQLLR